MEVVFKLLHTLHKLRLAKLSDVPNVISLPTEMYIEWCKDAQNYTQYKSNVHSAVGAFTKLQYQSHIFGTITINLKN